MPFKKQALRDLVVQRLAAAADEIFALFERTFAEYEEEVLRSKEEVLRSKEEALRSKAPVRELPLALQLRPTSPDRHELSPEPSLCVKEEEDPPPTLLFPGLKSEERPDHCASSQHHEYEQLPNNQSTYSCSDTAANNQSTYSCSDTAANNQSTYSCSDTAANNQSSYSCSDTAANNQSTYSCSDTDDSCDWEASGCRGTESDAQDSDLVLVGDGTEHNADFSPNSNDTQSAGLFVSAPLNRSEEPCSCSVCGQYFLQRSQLTQHMRTHAAEPFVCSLCSKVFAQKAHLKRHMHSHSQQKAFSCPECGLRLKQQHNMNRHISAVHRGEKPFACSFCQKAFAQKSDFVIHMRMHTGEKPFVCPHCHKDFRVRASLNKHIQKCSETKGP